MNTGISAINEAVKEAGAFTHPLFNELGKVIVGQKYLTERLVIGLLANGTPSSRTWPAWPRPSPSNPSPRAST